MPKLTSEEYAAIDGTRCPACGSLDIEGYDITVDYDTAHQECACLACGATWTDKYELVGYIELVEVTDGQ